MATVDISYLVPHLRLFIGDISPATYRYIDEWLLVALKASVKVLGSWWPDRNKYLIDESGLVYRNTLVSFPEAEPPVILPDDERPIIVMETIIILEGSLENTAWNLVSWRDNEIAFSNLESGRMKDRNITRLWNELLYLINPPTKKLARAIKRSLPGYLTNQYERSLTDP